MNSEFDIIKKYFTFSDSREDVLIAGGDDCASVSVPENKQLLVTTDTLISGVHFPDETTPEDIAYKAIMVNLSDLAAMGATPAWMTLAISLPEVDEDWLCRFSNTLSEVLRRFDVSLIGGDTTKGALSITVQAMGLCDKDKLLRRDQAKPGDKIYITGDIGDAAIGLLALSSALEDEMLQPCITRLNRPEARVRFAEELASYSSCAIDVSDGLVADLGHIISASFCGAQVFLSRIPLSSASRYYFEKYNNGIIDWSLLLTRGDDYELCFTLREDNESVVNDLARKHELKISCIGEIIETKELNFINPDGELESFADTGFKHF
ncbi:MAG: thiamine-phosphate kinase [Gammaproteobacteria bacterium]|nr:MAG: thiamine-phosphate kinase [Gammaproteobacteria bacterium]